MKNQLTISIDKRNQNAMNLFLTDYQAQNKYHGAVTIESIESGKSDRDKINYTLSFKTPYEIFFFGRAYGSSLLKYGMESAVR